MKGREPRRLETDKRLYREKQRQLRQKHSHSASMAGPEGPAVRDARLRRGRKRQQPRRSRRTGFIVLTVLLTFLAGLLIYNLYQIQIVNYAANAEAAASLHFKRVTENPRRGQIFDRNGVELAGTTYVYRIGITPKDVDSITKDISKREIADNIARCLNLNADEVYAQMLLTKETYIQLKKDVPSEEAEALKAYKKEMDLGGIRIDTEPRRYYTSGTLASQVIGYANFDSSNLVGQLGVEYQYNTLLTGEPGYTYVETDNYGSGQLPFSVPTSLRAKNGQNIVLNLDINIQKIAQEELENAINTYDVTNGGTVVIMNPYTGAVLAMASYPYFSSSDPTACPAGFDASAWDSSLQESIDYLSAKVWRNRAISDTFEPGSTMKSLTASIAFEENLTNESEIMSDAPIALADWYIRCSHTPDHGTETMQQGFWHSCNPIFAQLALRTGISTFYQYIRTFGLSATTGIDLPGEGSGILHANPTEIDLATLSYGESSTVTAIQLATAYCVLANGGNLVKPSIVKAVTDSKGAIVKEYQPETIRKVLSDSTTSRIRDLLEGVVLYGTGTAAYVEGYSVGGKTGTSTDEEGHHTLSFAGIAPCDSPEIVTLVVLDKPADDDVTSKAAAKTCGAIISRTLEYMGVSRQYSENDVSRLQAKTSVTNVTGQTYSAAMKALSSQGLKAEAGDAAMGADTLVQAQYPAAGTLLHSGGLVILYPVAEPEPAMVVVPDFTGKNVSECKSAAAECGLNILIVGDSLGLAASQDPAPTYGSGGTTGTTAGGTGETTAVTPAPVRRGSIVSISFVAIEEAVAQTSESE